MTEPAHPYQPTDDRRRAIAAAARSLIVEKGFEGLRTREIADRVGINIATLHYHVPGKEALVQLVAQSMVEDFMDLTRRYPGESLSPMQLLQLEFDKHRDTRRDNPELLLVMEEMSRRARHDESIARHINPMRSHWHTRIAGILASGIDDGTFRASLDAPSAAYMVIGVMIAGSTYRLDDDGMNRAIAELFRSILSDPAKARSDV
jgi:AcrR family transcriptional regulator